jgi:hypothetical protein
VKDLFVVDGGTQCPEGTLLCRVVCFVVLGGWVFYCLSRWRRHPTVFPRGLCGDRWGMEHRAQETAFAQVSDPEEWSG